MWLGIPDFLPGSKLERLNVKKIAPKVGERPTIYSSPP